MSNIKCPKCKEALLFLIIEHRYVFSVKDIGTEDVIPNEKVDAEGTKLLECLNCGWTGWTDEYLQIKEGIIPLFSNPLEAKYEKIT